MYSGISDSKRWLLPAVLQEAASRQPQQLWLETSDGDSLTFLEAAQAADTVAGFLHALGIRPGDRVAIMMENGIDFVRAWLGIGRLGAVAVLLNTEIRGLFLKHQLENSEARIVIANDSLVHVIQDVAGSSEALETLLICGSRHTATYPASASATGGVVRSLPWSLWTNATVFQGALPRYKDVAAIMYTSGTTGPSKGVLMTHAHCTLFGIGVAESMHVTTHDRYYIALPLFHANALLMQLGTTLIAQCSAYLNKRFSASQWIGDIRASGATLTNLLGATSAFVLAQPPSPQDRGHHLRAMFNAPNPPAHEEAFRTRFGVSDVISGFGMTEVASPVIGRVGRPAPGAAGWVDTERYEVIVADCDSDLPVPTASVGELLVRPKIPFTICSGYHRMPEKTVAAWRNGWFHTGDAAIMSADGLVTYVDRLDDCIRRRGQNVSPSEIEEALLDIAEISEVAAYAVPSELEGAEAEIALAVVLAPGANVSAQELGSRAEALLPRFARPRFVRILDSLPKTPTAKVQRAALRKQGCGSAFDRDKHGFSMSSQTKETT